MNIPTTLLAFSLALTGAFAQQNIVYHPNNTPSGGNAFPFGSEGIRYQSIMPNSLFGSPVATINDIYAFGRSSSTTSDLCVIYEDIEIRMGITQVTPSTMTTTFATNNPNPTTVYRGPLRVNFEAGKWAAIGLPKPYLFLGTNPNDNLCFEVIVWSAKTMITGPSSNFYYPGASSAVNRTFLYRWTTNQAATGITGTAGATLGFLLDDGNFVSNGKGCQSTSNTQLKITGNTYPQPTKDLTIGLTGGEPTTLSFLAFGPTFAPFELTPIGAPTCHVWTSPLLAVATVTDASGNVGITGTIPAASTSGTLYAQWYQMDATANAAGLTTSNFATIIFGR